MKKTGFERLYGVTTTGEFLGCGRAAVYQKIKTGKLRAIRDIEGRIKIPHSSIAEYLNQSTPVFA